MAKVMAVKKYAGGTPLVKRQRCLLNIYGDVAYWLAFLTASMHSLNIIDIVYTAHSRR